MTPPPLYKTYKKTDVFFRKTSLNSNTYKILKFQLVISVMACLIFSASALPTFYVGQPTPNAPAPSGDDVGKFLLKALVLLKIVVVDGLVAVQNSSIGDLVRPN